MAVCKSHECGSAYLVDSPAGDSSLKLGVIERYIGAAYNPGLHATCLHCLVCNTGSKQAGIAMMRCLPDTDGAGSTELNGTCRVPQTW